MNPKCIDQGGGAQKTEKSLRVKYCNLGCNSFAFRPMIVLKIHGD